MMKGYLVKIRLCILLMLVSGCSEVSLSDKLMQAESMYEEQKYSEVIIQTKNIIRDQPQNAQARILIANSYYQLGLFINAEKEYLKVLKLVNNPTNIAKNYLLTLYALDDHIGIITYWEKEEASLSIFEKAKISYIASLSYLNQAQAQNSFDLASLSKKWALELNEPELIAVNTAIADTYKQPANIEYTTKSLDKVCSDYPAQWLICQLLANALFSEKKYDEAALVYQNMLENKPNYNIIALKLADSYVRANNTEKATLFITALLEKYPNQPYINLLSASLDLVNKDYKKALNHINITLNQGMLTPQAKLTASLVHYHLGNDEQALSHLSALKVNFPNNPLITKLYIAIQLRLGDGSSIANAYDKTSSSKDNSEMFALASLELLKSGEKIESSQLLRKIDISLIENQKILNGISLAKLSSGDESGITDLEKSLKRLINTNAPVIEISKVKMLLISSLISANDSVKAKKYINSWIVEAPENIENKLLLVGLEMRKQSPDQNAIVKQYNSILLIDDNNVPANLYIGNILIAQDKHKEAATYIDKAIDKDKHTIQVIKGYLKVQESLVGKEKALENLINKYKNYPNDFQERFTLAQIYLLTGQAAKTIDLLKSIKFPPQYNTKKINLALAESYNKIEQYDEAITIYKSLISEDDQNNKIIEKLAMAYEKLNNLDKATQTFEELHSKYPDNTQIGLVLANFYIFNNKPDQAIGYIESLSNEQQKQPTVAGLKGKALFFSKRYSEALTLLTESYQQTNNQKLIPFIFDSNIRLNKPEKAAEIMDNYLELNPTEVTTRLYYANELYKSNKQKAILQYKKVIVNDESSIVALNNLAWILYESGRFIEAKKYIDKAVFLSPDNTDIKDTLAVIKAAISK
ncbi:MULTISPECIES: XrtA/PEP-CTERM system TPR-repeat protein PrsT [unclassified Colwellia]|uniref:XrtA/PEP-CTERM system TPR-repeat protein PrsT n=2 Tax=unclassified Colwellia TaxID=196834 RepID=UPI0015F3CAC2|nr:MULTISPECIES: XrtA/PEP-CTERM system TPR-repeat protein PrsT [unclassified Colwellia]MBA6234347.1 PEP-CTERM system TPR-repeat protein PrsT [Colwellia sp. MB02u-7]MBA6237515.1 PEP-CTERM system TPR-repeat protein PrsT [Colwellia sp. MB02u-11]MBA6300147.1 PEP-CTERM system TPR-repeat protein PrsT [Colwellia sp. MB3u-22]MBA6312223.1 PEP-CTERM system TPR-repeat protein PrsT [Colwellia sp. MB3u-64]